MSKRVKWVYPFSVMGWVNHSECALQLMMIYCVETPEMGVSILRDGVGKPFSVRPAADDDSLGINTVKKLLKYVSTRNSHKLKYLNDIFYLTFI